ncbi:Ribonuclease H-like superfamily [Sesbania bispinosa]|nr:Ribonuclease H-like superfamily [Sesbania bispinosa]
MAEINEPSTEEMDLLARSTKKAKVGENVNSEEEEDSDYEGTKNGDSTSGEEVGDSGDETMSEEEENEDNQMSRKEGCPEKGPPSGNIVEDGATRQGQDSEMNGAENVVANQAAPKDQSGGDDVYVPWMIVQNGGRRKQTNAVANSKKDVRNLVQREKNMADNPNTTGSHFSTLAENPQVVEELESAECNPIQALVKPHAPGTIEIKSQNAKAQSSGPKGNNTKVHQPIPTASAAREASKLGQENPQINSLMNSSTPQQHIPVVHPITIPHAKFIKTGLRVDDGVHNRRPPDPSNGKVDLKKTEESSAMSVDKEVEDAPPQMEIDPAMENLLLPKRGNPYDTILVGWNYPSNDWIKCKVDGAVRSSGSPTACGGVIRDASGQWLLGFSRLLGNTTITLAELWGIYIALSLAKEKGWMKQYGACYKALVCSFYQSAYLSYFQRRKQAR